MAYLEIMDALSVEAIKEAIAALPEQDKNVLAAWLNVQTMDEWEREMHRDFSPGGRGHHLAKKVREEIRAGGFRPMADGKSRR